MNNIGLLLYISLALYVIGLVTAILKRNRACLAVTAAGFAVYSLFLVQRSWIGDIFITGALFNGVFLLPWALSLCVILVMLAGRGRGSAGQGLTVVILFTALAVVYPGLVAAPMPVKVTAWSYSFFFTEVCAQACFILGGLFAMRALFGMPCDETVRLLLSWGFVLYTVAQVVGAIWAFLGWGSTFHWGAKHLQSAVIWIWYVNYLHLRYIPGRSERGTLWYALAGSILVIYAVFSYYAVELKMITGWLK